MLKLPHHKRYDFLPITKRKHYSWPGGKRLAFYVALNIEHFAFQAGLGIDPHNRTGPQTSRNYAWRDYGNRVGNWRFFEILDELKLPASILLNSAVCYEYPEIVEKIKQRGDDVAVEDMLVVEPQRHRLGVAGDAEVDQGLRLDCDCDQLVEAGVMLLAIGVDKGRSLLKEEAIAVHRCLRWRR